MSSTKVFREGKALMMKKMIYLAKRRRVPKIRYINEKVFGKGTLRMLDLLYQLSNECSFDNGIILRENKPHLLEWSWRMLQELFAHRREVNRRKIEPRRPAQRQNLDETLMLNCEEIIYDTAQDIECDRDDEQITSDPRTERFFDNDTVTHETSAIDDTIVANETTATNETTVIRAHLSPAHVTPKIVIDVEDTALTNKENIFKNVVSRRRRVSTPKKLNFQDTTIQKTTPDTPPKKQITRRTRNQTVLSTETFFDDSQMSTDNTMMNQTHNYSLRDRSIRIDYKSQCSMSTPRARRKTTSTKKNS